MAITARFTGGHVRPGDYVRVRRPEEIRSTLDLDGSLAGVPFMPEMLDSCGEVLRVVRRLEKTCIEGGLIRRFPGNDVVYLEAPRCNGAAHDGCDRGCRIFWKEAWLEKATEQTPSLRISDVEKRELREQLKTKRDQTHYYCQATEIAAATEKFPWKQKPWLVWVAIREVWVGNRTISEVIGLMKQWRKLSREKRELGADAHLIRGPHKKTPTEALGLQSGERVRVKTLEQITETLDTKSENRGLRIAPAMARNCGLEFEVLGRINRMISETTGEMRTVTNTVSLRNLECHCYYQFGGCPRGELQYWREIWLQRSSSRERPE